MTKKHFNAIAAVIEAERQLARPDQRAAVDSIAHRLADEFRGFDPNFNARRFLDACGVN